MAETGGLQSCCYAIRGFYSISLITLYSDLMMGLSQVKIAIVSLIELWYLMH